MVGFLKIWLGLLAFVGGYVALMAGIVVSYDTYGVWAIPAWMLVVSFAGAAIVRKFG